VALSGRRRFAGAAGGDGGVVDRDRAVSAAWRSERAERAVVFAPLFQGAVAACVAIIILLQASARARADGFALTQVAIGLPLA
jgi:hypothetical protein